VNIAYLSLNRGPNNYRPNPSRGEGLGAWAAQPGGVRGTLYPSLLGPGGTEGYNENNLPGD